MSKTSAKIIADTVHPVVKQARITTLEVYAPRFLLAEINTHRVLAKSAASSRAIPVKKRIEMVRDHGFIPEIFGKNKPGMQAELSVSEGVADRARRWWAHSMDAALDASSGMADDEVHKQHANRLLEPFAYYHGVITATEWVNFFDLRLHPDAQPEFQDLAHKMKVAMGSSTPNESRIHVPYVLDDTSLFTARMTFNEMFKVSAARCARVSYQTHDGKPFDLDRDVARCAELILGGHMSPFDHAARADTLLYTDGGDVADVPYDDATAFWATPGDHRQNWGWIPDRVNVEREAGMPPGRRDSYGPIDFNSP